MLSEIQKRFAKTLTKRFVKVKPLERKSPLPWSATHVLNAYDNDGNEYTVDVMFVSESEAVEFCDYFHSLINEKVECND